MITVHVIIFYKNPYWGLRDERNRNHFDHVKVHGSLKMAKQLVAEWVGKDRNDAVIHSVPLL